MKKFSLDFLDLSSNDFKDEVDLISISTMSKLKKFNLSNNKSLFPINNLDQLLKKSLNTILITNSFT